MTDWAIQTHNMTRKFGALTAINSLDLRIPRGQIYGFLGPNGCGKSTAIRMLTGLLRATTGTIDVLGYPLPSQAEALRWRIGYMTQTFSLYKDLTVTENLDFVSRLYSLSRPARRERIGSLLNLYDLVGLRNQRAGTMSGGQKQRLALAAATLHKPDLLFLDEPTSAVDPENRREFWERLFDLCDQGTTILVSTHYMDEAERCHSLAILESGNIRAQGTPDELMRTMGANVIEVSGPALRTVKQKIMAHSQVLSAAQLGSRLRVLVSRSCSEPVTWLSRELPPNCQCELVRPSLEDVFVTSTGERGAGNK